MKLPRNRRTAGGDKIDDSVVHLEGNLYGHPLAGLSWERMMEETPLKDDWEKFKVGSVRTFTVMPSIVNVDVFPIKVDESSAPM